MISWLENDPNYPPLPWWPPARKSLWLGEERVGVRGIMPCPPPPQSSPLPTGRQASRGRIRLGNFHVL